MKSFNWLTKFTRGYIHLKEESDWDGINGQFFPSKTFQSVGKYWVEENLWFIIHVVPLLIILVLLWFSPYNL